MTKDTIKANITFNWNHHNCKFLPGDKVQVKAPILSRHMNSTHYARENQVGNVIAVAVNAEGNIRSAKNSDPRRITRYYVEFPDNQVVPFYSHLITKVPVEVRRPGLLEHWDC